MAFLIKQNMIDVFGRISVTVSQAKCKAIMEIIHFRDDMSSAICVCRKEISKLMEFTRTLKCVFFTYLSFISKPTPKLYDLYLLQLCSHTTKNETNVDLTLLSDVSL